MLLLESLSAWRREQWFAYMMRMIIPSTATMVMPFAIHVSASVFMLLLACMFVCVCVCVCVCVYTYIHTHIHTNIYTHT
jgi:hypothetical protein